MVAGRYRIKRMYGLKDLPDGWYIYSRHIQGRFIVPERTLGRNLRRYRVSGRYTTRRAAINAAKRIQSRSNRFIKTMMKSHECKK